MSKKKCRCLCRCPSGNDRKKSRVSPSVSVTLSSLLGPSPFSPFGVSPDFIQRLSPSFYALNEEYENNDSGGCQSTGYPPDLSYPSDPRSDCSALTPVYRGGQDQWFTIIDAYPTHGPQNSDNNMNPTYGWPEWDGSTIFPAYSSNTLSTTDKQQYRVDWYKFLFPNYPNDFILRGLKQLYDSVLPFADDTQPTVSEMERWNLAVINHFRHLSGLPPATYLQELMIMCRWSRERKATTLWDTKYPGTFDSTYGPCVGGSNIHCGSTFKPSDIEDQKPYWNDYFCRYPCLPPHDLITLTQGSEAVTVWYNGNAMTAMSRNLRKLFESIVTSGGVNPIGGHQGPYALRQYVGLSKDRSKWTGDVFSPPSGFSF